MATEDLVHRLVTRLAGSDAPHLHSYALRILGSRMRPTTVDDEAHVGDLIKRRLVHEDRAADAVRFGDLWRRLQGKGTLRRRWALLYLLYEVGPSSAPSGARRETPFRLVSAGLSSFAGSVASSQQLETPRSTGYAPSTISFPASSTARTAPSTAPSTARSTAPSTVRGPEASRASAFDQYSKLESSACQVSEDQLLRDVVFTMHGIEGKYVRFDARVDGFVVDPSIGVPRATRDLVRRLCELGWMYRRLKQHVERSLKDPSLGLVGQAFCSAIQHHLQEYYRLVAVLEAQINVSPAADSTAPLTMSALEAPRAHGLTLRRLFVWVQQPIQSLRLLAVMADAAEGLKGGALTGAVHQYVQSGDPAAHKLASEVVSSTAEPIFAMVRRWILEGELEDAFHEFFVATDPDVPAARMWADKYRVRVEMLPPFIPRSLANKILTIGKSINFMRHYCQGAFDPALVAGQMEGLEFGKLSALEAALARTADATTRRLVSVMFDDYRLKEHLSAIKRYVLLGQGDFIELLMRNLGEDLSQPANKLQRHSLTGIVESAIRGSTAQYDDPEIVSRIDVRLLEASPGESGWDIFSLDYRVDSPLSTVLTPQAMQIYLNIFNFLWRLRRMEHSLSETWSWQMSTSRRLQTESYLYADLHKCHLLRAEMTHLIANLNYYVMFEVLEASWGELQADLVQAGDLDQVIGAHNAYLARIVDRALLGADSDEIRQHLYLVFQLIVRFHNAQQALYEAVIEETQRQHRASVENKKREMLGQWSSGAAGAESMRYRQLNAKVRNLIDSIATEYRAQVDGLKRVLGGAKQGDRLKFLQFRLST